MMAPTLKAVDSLIMLVSPPESMSVGILKRLNIIGIMGDGQTWTRQDTDALQSVT